MLNQPRARRPYEKKRASKVGALVFGIGLGALVITMVIISSLILPDISPHLDNLSYRARTYYRKLIPHPEYLPTPATVIREPVGQAEPEITQPESTLSPVASQPTLAADSLAPVPLARLTPAALNKAEDNLAVEDNLLLPLPSETDISVLPPDDEAQLTGFAHQWQTWNNCGPATVTTYLSYFGRTETQVDAAQFLKPNRDDKNVTPQELVAYVRSTGMDAVMRQGGNIEQLKSFVSNKLPVLLETWLVHEGDGLGHYRLITGYDEETRQFTTADSLNGPDHQVSYEQLDVDWRVFNRLYVVIYSPEQTKTVAAIIGNDMDDRVMHERLLAEAQAEIETNPDDAIAYFNQGEALTRLNRPQEAVIAFDRARQIGLHWRRLWYQFTPFEAYYAVGRYQDVLDLTEATLKGTGGLEEAYYYRGLALHATNQPGALEDFQAALAYNPNFKPATEALDQLTTSRQ